MTLMELLEFVDVLDRYKYFQETKENPMVFINYDASNMSWIVDGFGGCRRSYALGLSHVIELNAKDIVNKIKGTIYYIIPSAKYCMKINNTDVSYYIIDNNVYFDIEHISGLFFNECYFSKINEKAHLKISRKTIRINKEIYTVFSNIFANSEYPRFGFTVNPYGGLTIRNLISYQECFELLKHKNINMYLIKFNNIINRNNNYMVQVNNIPALPSYLIFTNEVVYIRVIFKNNNNIPYVKIVWSKNWLIHQNDTSDENIFCGDRKFLSKNICIKSQSILFFNKICDLLDKIEPSIKYQHINNTFSLIENKFVDDYVSKIYYYHPCILEYFNNTT